MAEDFFERFDHEQPPTSHTPEERKSVSLMPELSDEEFHRQMSEAESSPSIEPIVKKWDDVEHTEDDSFRESYRVVSETAARRYFDSPSGRVRATIPDTDVDSWGSGSLIAPRIVVTAAHVVSDGPSRTVFEPAWFTPRYPYETRQFFAKRTYIMPGWLGSGGNRWDLAILYTAESVPADGYHGVKVKVPGHGPKPRRGFGWITVAYPGDPPFGPQDKMISDGGPAAPEAFRKGDVYFQAYYQAWKSYDLTPGASGGPWLWWGDEGEVIWSGQRDHPRLGPAMLNGVNSFTRRNKPGIIFSPHFWDEHKEFFKATFNDILANP